LQLPNITTISSGTNVDLSSKEERLFFANTIDLFVRHGIIRYAKDTSDQLTQERTDNQDLTIVMNERVIDEARLIVTLSEKIIDWNIVNIGEGHRVISEDIRMYEELRHPGSPGGSHPEGYREVE
jgi:hypothetical protein